MMKKPTSIPRPRSTRVACCTVSTLTRRSMASRIRCDPLSDPIHTRKQPRSRNASATASSTRSALEMHSKGILIPRAFILAANSRVQPLWMVKTSSTNQIRSGA
jgi:hypothetical protein